MPRYRVEFKETRTHVAVIEADDAEIKRVVSARIAMHNLSR
jgi:hypothetical protein